MLRRGTENHSKVSRIRLKGDPAPNFGTFQMGIYFMSNRMGVSSGRFQLFFLFFSKNLRFHIDEDYRLGTKYNSNNINNAHWLTSPGCTFVSEKLARFERRPKCWLSCVDRNAGKSKITKGSVT